MSFPPRLVSCAWLLVMLAAASLILFTDLRRAARVDEVTNTDREAIADARSPTGYAGGKRWLIVPEHSNRSYQWIAETQEMFSAHEARIRRIFYENTPFGRPVYSASLYRWWLGVVAWGHHLLNGGPIGLSVERAALWADPVLHLLLLFGASVFVARRMGGFAAGLMAFGVASLFPFAGGFLPGVPGDQGLTHIAMFASVLPLVIARVGRGPYTRMFIAAGVAGGIGLWLHSANQTIILLGIVAAGLAVTGFTKIPSTAKSGATTTPLLPWRAWGLAGAATSLVAYLLEYFPDAMELRLEVNHPLFGLAWLGAGELMAQFGAWRERGKSYWNVRTVLQNLLAGAAVVALPIALRLTGTPFLPDDLAASRLTFLPNGVVASNVATWIHRDGMTAPLAATCLPVLLVIPAVILLVRRSTESRLRIALALALGPVVVTLMLATRQLAWWNTCDVALLALLAPIAAACTGELARPARALWSSFVILLFLPGLMQLAQSARLRDAGEFTRFEIEGLIERGLAHWIADRAGGDQAVVLLPPDRTASWCFHGGFRGIGTPNWENREGLAVTVRIVTAITQEEALALINRRGITHLVLPSWDTDLDQFARWSLSNPEDGFIMALHHWALPTWLRPLPYRLPVVAGFEGQSVVILEVTNDSSRAVALSRLAEYFVETEQPDLAASTIPAFARYPADLSALAALAQVHRATGNQAGFEKAFGALVGGLSTGADRTLAWDRRINLAIVLALGERNDLAKGQLRRAIERLDEARVRSLTTGTLFRLQVLARAYELPIADPKVRDLARQLMPAELRARL